MEWGIDRGYFYGVLLGDGHINYTKNDIENLRDREERRGPILELRTVDYEFVEAWRDSIESITGFKYKISKHSPGRLQDKHKQQFKVRIARQDLVQEAEEITKHKTIIPKEILNASDKIKKAFVLGLMDSEGWVNFYLSGGLKMNDMTLGFGCGDPWFGDFYSLVNSLGIKTSKVYKRKPTRNKKGELLKPLRLFKLDIPSYLRAGLSFTIKRKADRLEFCSRILNDYTCNYPRYEDYYLGGRYSLAYMETCR